MSKVKVICDVQGFRGKNNEFIIKEAAFLSISGSQSQTFVFRSPYPLSELPSIQQKVATWCKSFGHGIPWEDGTVPYWEVNAIFKKILGKCTTVYVKGEEKKFVVEEILKNQEIHVFNIENMLCPSLKDLKKRFNESRKCFFHSRITDNCAHENVCILFDWLYSTCLSTVEHVPSEKESTIRKVGEVIGKYNKKDEYGNASLKNLVIYELSYLPKEYYLNHVTYQELEDVYDYLPIQLKTSLKGMIYCLNHYNQPGATHVDGPPQKKSKCQQCMGLK